MKDRVQRPRRLERKDARRYFDIGASKAARRTGRVRKHAARGDARRRLVLRALKVLRAKDGARAAEYVVSDVFVDEKAARPSIVYFQQRHQGFAVYDGRRSVVFGRGAVKVTGERVDIKGSFVWNEKRKAEDALRRAVRSVLRALPGDPITLVSSFASPDEFHSFDWGKTIEEPHAHLVLFPRKKTYLAWVVSFTLEAGAAFEIVLDAKSLEILKRRVTSHHLSADVFISPQEPALTMNFDAAWGPPSWDRVRCFYNDAESALPANVNGTMASSARPERRALNVTALMSEGLALLEAAGARMLTVSGSIPEAWIYYGIYDTPDDAAGAFAEFIRLRALDRGGNTYKHAAEDPTVVLHEMSHIVLANNVGGKKFASPFESFGESGGVSEGLADFCGLTLFNRIARNATPQYAQIWIMGKWFLGAPRDYTGFRVPHPAAAYPSGNEIHRAGVALCGGLVASHFALGQSGAADDDADAILWTALFAALREAPHQGALPNFCCVTTRVIAALDAAASPLVQTAFQDVGLPLVCPHAA